MTLIDISKLSQEIHIWQASLDQPQRQIERFSGYLAADEMTRANRFRFDRDRRRFIVGRGLLRVLLSRYIDQPPDQIKFHYTAYGKPGLAGYAFKGESLQFNLSHSQEWVLYAFTLGALIGVDLEAIRPLSNLETMVEMLLSEREQGLFQTVSTNEKLSVFYNVWTRKEAYLKATGEGISRPLHSIEVSFCLTDPVKVLRIDGSIQKAAWWRLETPLPPPEGDRRRAFANALAYKSGRNEKSRVLRLYQWPEPELG